MSFSSGTALDTPWKLFDIKGQIDFEIKYYPTPGKL